MLIYKDFRAVNLENVCEIRKESGISDCITFYYNCVDTDTQYMFKEEFCFSSKEIRDETFAMILEFYAQGKKVCLLN